MITAFPKSMKIKTNYIQKIKEGAITALSLILCYTSISVCNYTQCCINSISGITMICILCLACIIMNRNYKAYINNILVTFFITGFIEFIHALMQMLKLQASNNPFYHFTGSFDNPAIFSMLMSLCIPIGIYLTINSSSFYKIACGIITTCMGISLALSNSRTATIAIFISLTYILYTQNKTKFKKYISKQKMLIVLLLTILCLGLYYYKQESANGRILIWKVSANMIADHPWGLGRSGFDAFYMPYQAAYFMNHPDSKYLLLADNTSHPFNEILLFTIKHGIPFSILMSCLLIFFFKQIYTKKDEYKTIWVCLSTTLLIWSLFSYPFQIPFIWLVTAFVISICLFKLALQNKLFKITALFTCLTGIILCVYTITSNVRQYNTTRSLDKAFGNEAKLSQYSLLYEDFKNQSDFLYRYGAELHHSGHYKKSLEILSECTRLYNDYNVQMLIAHNYQQLGNMDKAVESYRYANWMVPSRFLPLYYTMRLYMENNDTVKACEIADMIIHKPIKIKKSASTQRIVSEAKQLLYEISFLKNSIKYRYN